MKLKLILVLIIILIPFGFCQVPEDVDTKIVQKIDQEHKNTRKFLSDELTRQRTEMFKQLDDRANYYEDTVNDILTKTLWSLGLLWASVTLFVVGITSFLKVRLERRRYDRLQKNLFDEINRRMPIKRPATDNREEPKISQENFGFEIERERLMPRLKEKKPSFFEEMKKKKLQRLRDEKLKKLDNLRKSQAKLMQELEGL